MVKAGGAWSRQEETDCQVGKDDDAMGDIEADCKRLPLTGSKSTCVL